MARAALWSLLAAGASLGLAGISSGTPATSRGGPVRSISPTSAEIDAKLWAVAAAAVANDDIVALGRTYHTAAILVSAAGTKPIAQALDGWGKDIVNAKKAGTKATVAFRFSKRQDDAETAFESGIFRYATTTRAGVTTPGYTRFESLLIKSGGKWLTLMERQLDSVSESEWNALPH